MSCKSNPFPTVRAQNAFLENVLPYISSFTKVRFSDEELKKAKKFAQEKADCKVSSGERAHIIDGDKEYKRNLTGVLGEMAVEKYTQTKFVDWSVGKNSTVFNVPDVFVSGLGVKTVEFGKMPIVMANSHYPEIICIKNPDNTVYVCGAATVDVLKKYSSTEYILDPKLKARGTKTGFYGFNHLSPIFPFLKKTATA